MYSLKLENGAVVGKMSLTRAIEKLRNNNVVMAIVLNARVVLWWFEVR
jgi:hypothetical protein